MAQERSEKDESYLIETYDEKYIEDQQVVVDD